MTIDVMALAREAGGQTDWDKASRCDPELVDDDVVFERCYLDRFAELVQRATAAEWNFCPACGKRNGKEPHIHTCSPPA